MDKLVRRVTVVQSSGEHRDAKVVYENDEDEDTDDDSPGTPHFKRLERSVRHMLKAQVIAAQDAYQRHLDSVAKGGQQLDGGRSRKLHEGAQEGYEGDAQGVALRDAQDGI